MSVRPHLTRFAAAAAFTVLAALPAAAQPVAPGTRVDGIAAVVGEQIVLMSEVDAVVQQAAASQGIPVTDALWSRGLDQLIDRRVVIDAARRDTTLQIQEAQLTAEVERQIQGLIQQAGSEDALAAAYGRSIDELRALFREDVRDDLLLQQMRGRRMRDVSITPAEVQTWFDAVPAEQRTMVPELVRVAHIVRVPRASEAARTQARTFAQALRDSVASGQATIEVLADRWTQDPGNVNRTTGGRNGGRYDSFRLTDLDPTFAAAAGALAPGGLSQVFETSFGYHVLRLNTRDGDRVSFNHILINIPSAGSETATAVAELTALRDSVVTHGVPFEAVARRHSEDTFSASRGGFVADPQTRSRDLRLDALSPQWQATVATLDVGELSEPAPVQLFDGTAAMHVVLLQKRTPPHMLSIDDDYAMLREYALQDKQQGLLASWVSSLRPDVFVQIRAPRYVAATPAPAGS